MLGINLSDVISTIESVSTQLIVLGVVLLAAVLVTVFVNRRTVPNEARRKLVHAQTWIVTAMAAIACVGSMCFGPLSTMLSLASGEGSLTEETVAETEQLAVDIESEGIVLLKNDDSTLPLSGKKVNVFGWASTNPIYGGTGSGSMNDQYETTSILQSLTSAGIEYNTELTDFYTAYRADRPSFNVFYQDWTLPEPPVANYSDELLTNAESYSGTAIIVLARSGGEGFDLPADMGSMGDYRQFGAGTSEAVDPGETTEAVASYTNNSADYDDFQAGEGYLELSETERQMIAMVAENFEDVIVVYNGANPINLDFVDSYDNVKSVLWVPPAGQTGFEALGSVLTGAVNPSGKTTDTFVADVSAAPWQNTFGQHSYTNMSEYEFDTGFGKQTYHVTPSFVNYSEGIYVGYKYYETAAAEGVIDYDSVVQYPFAYGLSYTTFSQKMGQVNYAADGTITVDVTVTNTGSVAGKEVVEVFYNPPYNNGGIEKSVANLLDFEKTKLLEPGESQTITFSFVDEDMASYDYKGLVAEGGAYVLEAGDYVISINAGSHEVLDQATLNVASTKIYNDENDGARSSDKVAATNEFDDITPEFEILSRADHFANAETALAEPSTEMPEKYKETFVCAANYQSVNDDSDTMPTTGADNGVQLYELYGLDYDDPKWDELLDELTVDEMGNLISMAGYSNSAIESIGKASQSDVDGPSTLNNNFTGVGSIGLPSGVTVANTFSKNLAYQFGEMIGTMAQEMNVTGWYAPAMNIHRTPYSGRNFEYFSEDGVLSGTMAAQQIAGAKSKGVYAFAKHFALNDQETNRCAMLCTWADEQTMREIYLKPFEMTVKDGGTTAIMTSFNYIGNTYSASHSELLNDVLRAEWGFEGMVETDYFGGFGYQIGDQAMRAGNDAMLATISGENVIKDTTSATSVSAMRTASHNILYTAVNSWMYANGPVRVETPIWKYIYWGVTGVAAVGLVVAEVLSVRRFSRRIIAEA